MSSMSSTSTQRKQRQDQHQDVDVMEATERAVSGETGYVALSADQERELIDRGRAGDRDAFWALCMANQNFVRSLAQRYGRADVDTDDLVAEGLVGLMEAAERFDPSRGVKFITYGAWWIKRAMLRFLRTFEHPVHVPKYKQHAWHDFRRAGNRLAQELGRTPTLAELREETGADEREAQEFAALSAGAEALDDPCGRASTLTDSGDGADVEALVIQRDALMRLSQVLPVLTDRERLVLSERFGLESDEPVTLSELGTRVGLTKERVRQIEKEACTRLRLAMEGAGVVKAPARRARRSRATAA
jgi:RNA polymerase primary sigma factor